MSQPGATVRNIDYGVDYKRAILEALCAQLDQAMQQLDAINLPTHTFTSSIPVLVREEGMKIPASMELRVTEGIGMTGEKGIVTILMSYDVTKQAMGTLHGDHEKIMEPLHNVFYDLLCATRENGKRGIRFCLNMEDDSASGVPSVDELLTLSKGGCAFIKEKHKGESGNHAASGTYTLWLHRDDLPLLKEAAERLVDEMTPLDVTRRNARVWR